MIIIAAISLEKREVRSSIAHIGVLGIVGSGVSLDFTACKIDQCKKVRGFIQYKMYVRRWKEACVI